MPNKCLQLLILNATLLFGLGCESSTEPHSKPQVAVTALRPVANGGLPIEYEFRNRTPNTLYLFECGGNVFSQVTVRETNGRTDSWSTICLGIWIVKEIPVAAGAVFRGGRAVQAFSGAAYTLAITYSTNPARMEGHQVAEARSVRWRP